MHKNVADAVMRLQRRLDNLPNSDAAEQTEQALDLLLNQPDNRAPPTRQIRNALSEARKKLKRRKQLLETPEAKAGAIALTSSSRAMGLEWLLQIEIEDFINRMVAQSDRRLLREALSGVGAEGIAAELGIRIARARERLSRARARAFPLWIN